MKIEPDVFDLVVVGTGLQESLVASSAALTGKKVLHLDGQRYYGDTWAGLNLDEFVDRISLASGSLSIGEETGSDVHVMTGIPCLYRGVDVVRRDDEALGSSKEYIIDLVPKVKAPYGYIEMATGHKLTATYKCVTGYRVTYQAGPMLDALVQTKAHNYVDYRLIESSFIVSEGELFKIPSSRSDIFKDDRLKSIQKRTLTGFLKNAVERMESSMFHPEELQDFDEWMASHGLDDAMSEMVRSGVCFSSEHSTSLEKYEALGMYLRSAGRLKAQSGPFIVPFYSASDVPQAFCRLCAVHGGIYVLQCQIKSVRYDPEASDIIEVITEYDQTIRCSRLCLPVGYLTVAPSLKSRLPDAVREETISRMVSVMNQSICDDIQQTFFVIPRGHRSPVYFLQVGAPTCPSGRYILYGWCRSESEEAKADFRDALDVLLKATKTDHTSASLFECYYQQALLESPGGILPHLVFTGGPSGMIGHAKDIRSAKASFHWLYPNEAFLGHPTGIDVSYEDSDDEMFAALENELSQSDPHVSANGT